MPICLASGSRVRSWGPSRDNVGQSGLGLGRTEEGGQEACLLLPLNLSRARASQWLSWESGSLHEDSLCGLYLDDVAWPLLQVEMLLSNFGGQLGLWMSCSIVCVIEIIEVFFIDSLSIIARQQWQKARRWWAQRQAPSCPEARASHRGQDNPVLDIDDDLPTFTSALRLPPAPGAQVPGTPPPRYNTLRLERAFSSQLTDTQVPAES